ncbi:hypothetical protein BDV12DRAFT_174752 [Aspergillus spectabilis]
MSYRPVPRSRAMSGRLVVNSNSPPNRGYGRVEWPPSGKYLLLWLYCILTLGFAHTATMTFLLGL